MPRVIPDFEHVKLERFDKTKGVMYVWKGGSVIHAYKLNGTPIVTIAIDQPDKISFKHVKWQMQALIKTEAIK